MTGQSNGRLRTRCRRVFVPGLECSGVLAWLGPRTRHLQALANDNGWLVAWGHAPEIVRSPRQVRAPRGSAVVSERGWPGQIEGGALVQLPYDWVAEPYGSPSHSGPTPVLPGRQWRLEHAIVSADGGAWVNAPRGDIGWIVNQLRQQAERPRRTGAVHLRQLNDAVQTEADYSQMIQQTKDLIGRGACYQLNCTVPFIFQVSAANGLASDIDLWQRLRKNSSASYAAFLRWPGRSVISCSPECLLHADRGRAWTKPIKGSRTPCAQNELVASEKDAAELAMIVDLARNDLGRLAETGTVRVQGPETLQLEYISHREATVSASLRPTVSWGDLLQALFPAGSITGAPKAAAMHHLRSLEQRQRSAYCGTIGWIASGVRGVHGACSVAIRTGELHGQVFSWQVGGGIVIDSQAADEWQEVLTKSGPVLDLCE